MCNASLGLSQAFERLELLMLGAVGFIHERWQKKLSCSYFIAT
jgi:hypothetical protein